MQISRAVPSQACQRKEATVYHILLTTKYDEVINNPKHSFYVTAQLAHLTCTASATTEDRARHRAQIKLVTRLDKNEAYLEQWAREYRPETVNKGE